MGTLIAAAVAILLIVLIYFTSEDKYKWGGWLFLIGWMGLLFCFSLFYPLFFLAPKVFLMSTMQGVAWAEKRGRKVPEWTIGVLGLGSIVVAILMVVYLVKTFQL